MTDRMVRHRRSLMLPVPSWGWMMLTRAGIEERLRPGSGYQMNPIGDAEALETAQQLAEWVEALAVFPDDEVADLGRQGSWLQIDRSLWGRQAVEYDAATKEARAWLEGK